MKQITSLFLLGVAIALKVSAAQTSSDRDLARMLADENTRGTAVNMVVADAETKIPLLLSWTDMPPKQVDAIELNIGMADAFGATKTKAAITFLIKNISIDRSHAVNTWLKSPKTIEGRLAAAAALIRIGPIALDAMIRASWRPMLAEDRLAIIFAVSQMADGPGAREFLRSALGEANEQRYWAEAGLKSSGSGR